MTIFGTFLHLSSLKPYEITHRTKKVMILHIASLQRMSELFTYGGLNGCVHEKDNDDNEYRKYVCCGKIGLEDREGRNLVGYVLEENEENELVVYVEDSTTTITIKRPEYVAEVGRYHLCQVSECSNVQMTEYWPIRLRINTNSGQCSFTLNQVSIVEEPNKSKYVQTL